MQGETLNLRPSSLLSMNSGCKYCKMSTPERVISNALKENKIDYKIQYKFKDCLGETKIQLPFDFAIFTGGDLRLLIEYDGQHHFSEKAFGKESFERTVKNDNIKNKYCEDNCIEIIRIPYWELPNLSEILTVIITLIQ